MNKNAQVLLVTGGKMNDGDGDYDLSSTEVSLQNLLKCVL